MDCQKTELILEYFKDNLYVVLERDIKSGQIIHRHRVGDSPQKALARFQADGGKPDKVKIPPIMEVLMNPVFEYKSRGK